jgi:hypothetical protein
MSTQWHKISSQNIRSDSVKDDILYIKKVHYCQGNMNETVKCSNMIDSDIYKIDKYCYAHTPILYTKPDQCPICLNGIKKITNPLSCGHWAHRKCVLKWKDQCPICKAVIKISDSERAGLIKKDIVITDFTIETIINSFMIELEDDSEVLSFDLILWI